MTPDPCGASCSATETPLAEARLQAVHDEVSRFSPLEVLRRTLLSIYGEHQDCSDPVAARAFGHLAGGRCAATDALLALVVHGAASYAGGPT